MWRSRALLLCWALLLLAGNAQARLCWPPVIEQGRRLQERFSLPVTWLPLLLRQHEVCWRRSERPEQRVFLTGSSGVYGFPLPAADSVAGRLNARAAPGGAHYFNLGHPFTYQVKDALILHEALAYGPDLIVHSVSLDDFVHRAPTGFAPLQALLDGNRGAIAALAATTPAGLTEPLLRLREAQRENQALRPLAFQNLRQAGRLLRMTARAHAEWLRDSLFMRSEVLPPPAVPPEELARLRRQGRYDCAATRRDFREKFARWQEWNILAYLEQIRGDHGVPVVVVNWPMAHEPVDDCYNVRVTSAALRGFNRWLAAEARDRDLPLLDYHALLPADAFFDSIHPTADGQARIAAALARDLSPFVGGAP